jgi:beta-N-acetylhexosaminidase
MTKRIARGPAMIGIEALALGERDRARLLHPSVGGVILFSRNYERGEQLRALTASIRELRTPPLVIGVDHEGGRVQRFRDDFTAIAPMRELGLAFDRDRDQSLRDAELLGRTIAMELRAHGVDFSFTPVLDLDYGRSAVIGNRALHCEAEVVTALAGALVRGLASGGAPAVGKHFPGHGFVEADSHHALPIDPRTLEELADDLKPFAALAKGELAAVMPAHIVYPAVDPAPAGYSTRWIGDILRGRLGFEGLVFSDDLEMAGAQGAGDIVARADAALAAGCDVVLVCSDFGAMDALLARWRPRANADLGRRWARMAGS